MKIIVLISLYLIIFSLNDFLNVKPDEKNNIRANAKTATPEQVHIGFGFSTTAMRVNWVTSDNPQLSVAPEVQWGTSTTLGKTAKGSTYRFTVDAGRQWSTHTVEMTQLTPETVYY